MFVYQRVNRPNTAVALRLSHASDMAQGSTRWNSSRCWDPMSSLFLFGGESNKAEVPR